VTKKAVIDTHAVTKKAVIDTHAVTKKAVVDTHAKTTDLTKRGELASDQAWPRERQLDRR